MKIPIAPADYDDLTIAAIKALAQGRASESQQRRALEWIIHNVARTYDETFVEGKPDVSDYLAGKRNVGLQIIKLINLPLSEDAASKKEIL